MSLASKHLLTKFSKAGHSFTARPGSRQPAHSQRHLPSQQDQDHEDDLIIQLAHFNKRLPAETQKRNGSSSVDAVTGNNVVPAGDLEHSVKQPRPTRDPISGANQPATPAKAEISKTAEVDKISGQQPHADPVPGPSQTYKDKDTSQSALEVSSMAAAADLSSPLRSITPSPVDNRKRKYLVANVAQYDTSHIDKETSSNGNGFNPQPSHGVDSSRPVMFREQDNNEESDFKGPGSLNRASFMTSRSTGSIPDKQGPRRSLLDDSSDVDDSNAAPYGAREGNEGLSPSERWQNLKNRLMGRNQNNELNREIFVDIRKEIDKYVLPGVVMHQRDHCDPKATHTVEPGDDTSSCVVKYNCERNRAGLERIIKKALRDWGKECRWCGLPPKVKYDRSLKASWVSMSSEFLTASHPALSPPSSTIGGVILVDGKPFGLTTSHGLYYSRYLKATERQEQDPDSKFDLEGINTVVPTKPASGLRVSNREAFTSRNRLFGEVKFYQFSQTLFSYYDGRETREHNSAADWALVELEGDEIPMNTVLSRWLSMNPKEKSAANPPAEKLHGRMNMEQTEEVLWPTDRPAAASEADLIEEILTESEFKENLSDEDVGQIPCVVVTASSVINGFLGWGASSFSMYGKNLNVLRIDLESQLGANLCFFLLLPILRTFTDIPRL